MQQAEAKGVRLVTEFPNIEEDNLLKHSPWLYADEHRIMQVLLNLQSNALKFTAAGSVKVRVSIQADGDDQDLVVSVSDTGTGISEANQARLFKLFGFIEETQEINTNGIGLGLAICKMIVEQYGGSITV